VKRLGVVVNPVAGIGGRVGLKGSDGQATVQKALELGAIPEAPVRARRALERLVPLLDAIEVYTWPGAMGEDEALEAGLRPRVLGSLAGRRTWASPGGRPSGRFLTTTAADTEQAVRDLVAAGVDLLLFAGGDGTARDICSVIGDRLPVVGVPAGVKIHSAVYCASPAAAAAVVAAYFGARSAAVRLREAEVMDIDEDAFREGRVSARLYGYMTVPYIRGLTQSAKAGGVAGEERALNDIATDVIGSLLPDVLYVLGPGTTTRTIAHRLGIEKTLLGVDAVLDGQLIGRDLRESGLLGLLAQHPSAQIVVTAIGGQGHILGRGNQQLSPEVIRRVGVANIVVVATQTKLLSLAGQPLLADTGDPALDAELRGYAKVITGIGERMMYPIE
jgi:predicted polyphosphate/ATP-dependent NAD kinase